MITLACCGLFHYKSPVRILSEAGKLQRFIFSHRVSTLRGEPFAYNIFAKEYALRFAMRVFPSKWHSTIFPRIHDYWDIRAQKLVGGGRVTFVMLHGTARRVMERARASGQIVVGEAVNTHPENYLRVINDEHRALGLPELDSGSLQLKRLCRELELIDHLFVPSKAVWESFVSRGYDPSRITICPFGVSLDAFSPPSDWNHRLKPKLRCVCVAQVAPRKGIRTLLEAWRLLGLRPEAAELRIIGLIQDNMRELVASAPPGVTFLGASPKHLVIEELRASSVFVLPTLEEGFAVSILEAMACGCAVVTSTSSGADSVIVDGVNGFLLRSGAPALYASILKRLYDAPSLRGSIGLAGSQSVRAGFGWDNYCSGVLSSLDNIMEGS